MATFEAQIEGITQIAIGEATSPTQDEVTQFLNDGIKDLTNKVISLKPDDAFKFASDVKDDDGSGIEINGKILSVVRENGSDSDLRPASQISPQLRYLASDKSSLHYRTSYNPAFYLLNKKAYIIPSPSGAGQEGIVSCINYATAFYNQSTIQDFPDEYENSITLYAASMSCNAAATSIHNNLPDKPAVPAAPLFSSDTDTLPEAPVYLPPELTISYQSIESALAKQDLELAEKRMNITEKRLDEWTKKSEIETTHFQKELEIFKASLEKSVKDFDRRAQVEAGEYRSKILKYQYDITDYQARLSEEIAQYKWYMEEHFSLMKQYNESIIRIPMPQSKKKGQGSQQKPRQQQQQEQAGY